MATPKKASSQAAWALLSEGLSKARVDAHRLRLLVDRAKAVVDGLGDPEPVWEAAGDLILGVPERLTQLESDLDRTAYALTLMGEDFLRSRLTVSDREWVDEGLASAANPLGDKVSGRRVASRWLAATVAPSAEGHFVNLPKHREVREFAQSGAISNFPEASAVAIRHMDNATETVGEAVSNAEASPPDPLLIERGPGGKSFSTLNRYVVNTEEPGNPGLPKRRSELPVHPVLKTRSIL